MINWVNGDILDAEEFIVCHQVNCFGVMGAGLAKQIKNRYIKAFNEYQKLCKEKNYDYSLLGTAQIVPCYGIKVGDFKIIANIFGQYRYGTGVIQTNYEALEVGFRQVRDYADNHGFSIAIPYGIGCGLAGGDWDKVYWIIKTTFDNRDVTIYKISK
jgi:O-acetyl-ADP-ribose deacetylase (regulator of RNase III)